MKIELTDDDLSWLLALLHHACENSMDRDKEFYDRCNNLRVKVWQPEADNALAEEVNRRFRAILRKSVRTAA